VTGFRFPGPFPGLDRRACCHLLAAIGIALTGELAAVGLLATGAWLLLSAALRPPILLLSIAIGAVQVLSLLRGTARYAERLASHRVGLGLQAALRTWLYRRLERLVPAGLPGGDRGDLLTRLISDTEEAQDLIVRAAVPVLAAAAAWCAAVTATAILLPAAGLALLAAGVSGAAGITVAVLLADRNSAALPAARGAVGSWILGVLGSSEELAAAGAADWVLAQLAERERALGTRTRALAAAAGLGRVSIALAGGAGLAGVAWTGAAAQRSGRISPVELGVLVFMALGVAGLLQGLPDAVSRLPVGRASLQRLAGLSRLPGPVVAYAEDGGRYERAMTPDPALAGSHRSTATVVLRGAALAYPHRRGPVLRGLDLELAPGRPVALIGPSGSGKTSVVLALLRFIDLSAGRLTVDGADARMLPPEQIRALIAWSPEQSALFPAPLRANLRVGAPHAADRQITELLGLLGLGPWLDQLESGLDTVIASWGHPVSGGELQRLSVARALLANRPVLLLDEPTGHLDPDAAATVLNAVLELAADRSLLWITHRPEELRQFPEVCRLNPLDLGDAVDPAVPGQGGDEAEQVRYPDLEDRLAGQVPGGQQREAGAVTGLVDRFGRPAGRALPAPNATLRTWLPEG
jgi:thiol reductant ABC exporter CydC subunit